MPLGTGTKLFLGLGGGSIATGAGLSAIRYNQNKEQLSKLPENSEKRRELRSYIQRPGIIGGVVGAGALIQAKKFHDSYKLLDQLGFKGFRDAFRHAGGFDGQPNFDEQKFNDFFRKNFDGEGRYYNDHKGRRSYYYRGRYKGTGSQHNSASNMGHEDIFKKWDIPPGASPQDVKAAFRARAKKMHPDVNPGDPNATKNMADLNAEAERLRSMGKMAQLGFHKSAEYFDYHDVENHVGLYFDDKTENKVRKMVAQQKGQRFPLRHPWLTGIPSLGLVPAVSKENAIHEITRNLFRDNAKMQDRSWRAREVRAREQAAMAQYLARYQ